MLGHSGARVFARTSDVQLHIGESRGYLNNVEVPGSALRTVPERQGTKMLFTADHDEPRRALQKFIAAEINPFVDEWEKADIFPAHELFKKLGDLGFLGLNKPVEFGGQGLDYSYALMMAEELGAIRCGAVPMAIGVQTDMATPALAPFRSDQDRRGIPAPAQSGGAIPCLGLAFTSAGPNRAAYQ